MRSISWFLMAVLVLDLGIFLIGKTPCNQTAATSMETADVLMEPFVDAVMQVIANEAAPYYNGQQAADIYNDIIANSVMERSEDRTVYGRAVDNSLYTTITGVGAQGDHPLKGPFVAGRFQVYTMGRACRYWQPFT